MDIGTCSYFTVAKLARFLGYRPDEIVYEKEDFELCFRECLKEEVLHLEQKGYELFGETRNAYEYYVKQKGFQKPKQK